MSDRKPYSSDVSDEQWVLVEPVISAWKAAHLSVSGHQGGYAMREIVNGILYQDRSGSQWDLLPHDLPPAGAVKYYFYKWRDDGTDQTIHDLLRWQLREKRKRLADPSLVVLDTQSIHAAVGVPATTTDLDAAKKVPGRKGCLAVGTLGLVTAVVVPAASVHDNAAGTTLLDGVAEQTNTVRKPWSTRASRRPSSSTARSVASTSRSSNAIPPTRDSPAGQALGCGADEQDTCSTGAWFVTTSTQQLPLPRVLGDDLRHGPPHHRCHGPLLEDYLTANPQISAVMAWIEAREYELSEQARLRIEDLTARLGELDAENEDLRIIRKTLLAIPVPPPAEETPRLDMPDHPAYRQILAALTGAGRPMRARDLCEALDLPILPKASGAS